jgi:hypothetical protein
MKPPDPRLSGRWDGVDNKRFNLKRFNLIERFALTATSRTPHLDLRLQPTHGAVNVSVYFKARTTITKPFVVRTIASGHHLIRHHYIWRVDGGFEGGTV